MSDKWLDPKESPPPYGKKVLILTCELVPIVGLWRNDAKYCYWKPIPSITKEIRNKCKEVRGYEA